MNDSMRQYWNGLSARERLTVGGGAVLLGLMLLYALLWQPLLDGRSRMQKLLPRQQQTLRQVQQLVGQIQAQQSGAATGLRLERDSALGQASASAAVSPSSVQSLAGERIKVTFDQVQFGQWAKFAAAMQSSGWPVLTAEIAALDRTGKVRASAEFGR